MKTTAALVTRLMFVPSVGLGQARAADTFRQLTTLREIGTKLAGQELAYRSPTALVKGDRRDDVAPRQRT